MLSEKDQIINLLRDELTRKNETINYLLERQSVLDKKLKTIDEVLDYD